MLTPSQIDNEANKRFPAINDELNRLKRIAFRQGADWVNEMPPQENKEPKRLCDMTLTQLLDAAISMAESEHDANARIVLLILSGARCSGHDGLLASLCQQATKYVFMPQTKERHNATKN
jgi:hypothetical protein